MSFPAGVIPIRRRRSPRLLPEVDTALRAALQKLEREFRDVQDVEFTIEDGKLWLLQTRAAKRTPDAAIRFAIDFVKEGLITPAEALRRIAGVDLQNLAHKTLVGVGAPAGQGKGASTGIAIGRVAFNSASATRLAESGEPVILVRPNINTADVGGFAACAEFWRRSAAAPPMRRWSPANWESPASLAARRLRSIPPSKRRSSPAVIFTKATGCPSTANRVRFSSAGARSRSRRRRPSSRKSAAGNRLRRPSPRPDPCRGSRLAGAAPAG